MKTLIFILSLALSFPSICQNYDSIVQKNAQYFYSITSSDGSYVKIQIFKNLYVLGSLGRCITYDNSKNITILLDERFIKKALKRNDYNAVKILIYHELLHGLFKAKHCSGINIMNDKLIATYRSFKKINVNELLINYFNQASMIFHPNYN